MASNNKGPIEEIELSSDESDDETPIVINIKKTQLGLPLEMAVQVLKAKDPFVNTDKFKTFIKKETFILPKTDSSDVECLATSNYFHQPRITGFNRLHDTINVKNYQLDDQPLDLSKAINDSNHKQFNKAKNVMETSIKDKEDNKFCQNNDKNLKQDNPKHEYEHKLLTNLKTSEKKENQFGNSNDKINKDFSPKREIFDEELIIDENEEINDVKDEEIDIKNINFKREGKANKIRTKRFVQLNCDNCISKMKTKKSFYLQKGRSICSRCDEKLTFQCKICQSKFESNSSFVRHLTYECIPEQFWSCKECKFVTTSIEVLETHQKRMHTYVNPKDYENCEKCKKTFKLKQDFKKHKCVIKINGKRNYNKQSKTEQKKVKLSSTSNESSTTSLDLDQLLMLRCVFCNKNIEKSNEKNCSKCQNLLLWYCVKCELTSKSFCGIYDHLQNECNKKCNNCDKIFFNKEDMIHHQKLCFKYSCKICKFYTKKQYAYNVHLESARHKENVVQ